MPEMVTSTYQNLVRNILALVLGTLKIFTHATRKCRLKGKIVLCGGGQKFEKLPYVIKEQPLTQIVVRFSKKGKKIWKKNPNPMLN